MAALAKLTELAVFIVIQMLNFHVQFNFDEYIWFDL